MLRRLVVVATVLFAGACVAGSVPTSTPPPPPSTTTTSTVSTTTTTTVTDPVAAPTLAEYDKQGSVPIVTVDNAVLNIDGGCVTAVTETKVILLVQGVFPLSVVGTDLVVGLASWYSGVMPDRVMRSGDRYLFRGVPDEFVVGDLASPLPEDCVYDERMLLLGALDWPIGEGLATRPTDVWTAFPSIGASAVELTIDGPCTTIPWAGGTLLVSWPDGAVSLIDDQTIHLSRWEGLADMVVGSGDVVSLQGGGDVGYEVDDPPPGCEYDGVFYAGTVSLP